MYMYNVCDVEVASVVVPSILYRLQEWHVHGL